MARGKRLTVEELWKLERPAHPSLSPDGAQVCLSVTAYDMKENRGRASLWLLSAFGGEPRRLTTMGEKDGEPRWSPDGRWIAFVAKRPGHGAEEGDDEAQVYVIAPDGGEARRLTDIPTGVSGIKWFPDSRRLAFISWVWPDSGMGKLERRWKEHKESKVKAHVVEQSRYRFWDRWMTDGRVPHVFTVDLDTGRMRDLFAGTKYELYKADTCAHYYDISPDGREIAFAHDPEEDKRFDDEQQLVTVEVKGARFKALTGTRLSHELPRYSPDGRHIALLTQDLKKSPRAPYRVSLIDRKTGRLQVLASKWDGTIHAPLAWSADSKAVYFCAEEKARQNLYRWTLGKQAPEVAVAGGMVTDFDLAGEAIAYIRNDMSSPPGVFWTDGAEPRRIDRLNDDVMKRVKVGEVREFHIKGFGGDEVQMWVVYPPDFDPKKRWPLLHNIHGGPHSIWGDNFHFRWNNQAFAAMGYVVVAVNYHGSSSFGQKWIESLVGEMGKREMFDVEAATDFMLKQGYIDPNRLVASGGSYGGYMVAWLNGHTNRYKAYVCHAGVFDWVAEHSADSWYWTSHALGAEYWDDSTRAESQNPRAFVKGMKTPTLVIHGALDYRVPDAQGLAYYNALKGKGVPARLVFYPDENHWILKPQNSRLWYREFEQWLERWVEPGGKKRR